MSDRPNHPTPEDPRGDAQDDSRLHREAELRRVRERLERLAAGEPDVI